MVGFRNSGSLNLPMSYDFESELFNSRGNGRFWRNYSSLEKTLWVVLGIVSVIVIGLIIAVCLVGIELGKVESPLFTRPTVSTPPPWVTNRTTTSTIRTTTRRTTTTRPPGWNQCLERECVIAAARISNSIDNSVEPCNDFYQYACGRWVQENSIPLTNNRWGQVDVMQDQLILQIRDILTDEIEENVTYPEPFYLAKDFYKTCTQQDDDVTLTSVLAELATGLLEKLETDNLPALGETLGNIRREIGGNYLFTLYVNLNENNSTGHIIYLDQPNFGLARELLLIENEDDKFFRDAYRNLVEQLWEIVFLVPKVQAEEIAIKIVDFEIKLANISSKEEDRRNRTELYNPYTLEDLMTLTTGPNFTWGVYFENVFLNLSNDTDLDFEKMIYIVRDIQFFKKFVQTIEEVNLIDLSNYLKWRIILEYGNEVNKELSQLFFDYFQETQGLVFPTQIWKTCVEQTNNFFGMAISYQYVEEHFSNELIEKTSILVEKVQEAFLETLVTLDWIDNDAKTWIANKVEKITSYIGFPSWIKNESIINEYYHGVELTTPNNHFNNFLNLSKWHNRMELSEILNPKNPDTWLIDPTIIDSFYSPNYNSINFPAGILQNPFFRMPLEALNYGAIGAIIGHEITQGFSDTGIQSDGDGNLMDWSWWNETTLQTYLEKTECFIKQYENYTVEEIGLSLNGKITLGENIADNGGLRQAFKAYQKYLEENGDEKLLPGMTEFTSQKLFFLSYAQTFCGSYTLPNLRQLISTGHETPNRFRLQGTLANSIEFAQTWDCPVPEYSETCHIW